MIFNEIIIKIKVICKMNKIVARIGSTPLCNPELNNSGLQGGVCITHVNKN